MDEPTNHLDIRSKAILKQALESFDGTLILVSHDRDFLSGLTNKTYEFRDGHIKEYLGDIGFYLSQRRVESFREMELQQSVPEPKAGPGFPPLGRQVGRTHGSNRCCRETNPSHPGPNGKRRRRLCAGPGTR